MLEPLLRSSVFSCERGRDVNIDFPFSSFIFIYREEERMNAKWMCLKLLSSIPVQFSSDHGGDGVSAQLLCHTHISISLQVIWHSKVSLFIGVSNSYIPIQYSPSNSDQVARTRPDLLKLRHYYLAIHTLTVLCTVLMQLILITLFWSLCKHT